MADEQPVLAVEGIVAGYFPDVPILDGVDVTVGRGEMVTIVGPNGAGKSTLVKVVIGLLASVARDGSPARRGRHGPQAARRSWRAASGTSPSATTSSRR